MSDLLGAARRFPWRKPDSPREQPCISCGSAATCAIGNTKYCPECVPPDFWPKGKAK